MEKLQPDLSIVIVNWNTRRLLLDTIASIYCNPPDPYSFEIIVVDNGSSDGSRAALQTIFPAVILIANHENRGFGPANNQGLQIARGRYCLLLNSDVVVQAGSLSRALDFMETQQAAGMCGIRLLNPDGSFQGSYAPYLNLWREFLILTTLGRRLISPQYPGRSEARSRRSRPVPVIQGAFMLLRTEALRQIGWLDEQFFMYGEENDLSRRLYRAGWQVYYLADINIIHLGGQSSRQNWTRMAWQLQKSKVLLFRKHNSYLEALLLKSLVSLAFITKLLLALVKNLLQFKPRVAAPAGQVNFREWLNYLST